ncbi:MAG: acetyl-CoA carboxylase carboxyltransferase subunit alpha [Candidatus Melainabacteria bacterium]|nr:acetyl-CoA carboxylase carboxyltransferase subunit alpha [Candidatus Melainabacteria bacterium]
MPARESMFVLEFEKPLQLLEQKIEELQSLAHSSGVDFDAEVFRLRQQAEEVKARLYEGLTAAQKLQVARHPQRPNFLELVQALSPNLWLELRGDRAGCDDRAILGGIAELNGRPVLVVGTQKGRGMKENLSHNFGMANPEGYRKALRLFQHAEKFKMPVITIIDTPGAYPGMHGEEHAIGHAIATNIREMARLRVPILSLVTGEASSGGALGIGVADRIYMLQHALYTVISPEGCASILWRSATEAARAADALKITAQDLLGFGIVDAVIEEPLGGAHQDPALLAERVALQLTEGLCSLREQSVEQLLERRYQKYRCIGAFEERALATSTAR